MDVQLFLAVNIMAMAAIAIVAILVHARASQAWPWIAVNGGVLGVGLACLQWWPGWAGVITASLYVPFVLAPMLLNSRAQRALLNSDTKQAARYLKAAALLHPTPVMRFSAAMTEAQAYDGEDARIAALEALQHTATAEQKTVIRAVILRTRDDWDGILRTIRQRPAPTATPASNFDTSALEIRALGETGRTDEMVRRFNDVSPALHAGDQAQCQMLVLAFCGKPGELRRLFEQPLSGLDGEAKTYWVAIAERAAGASPETWMAPLRILADTSAKPDMRRRAERQLKVTSHAAPLDHREPLSGAATAILNRLTQRLAPTNASSTSAPPEHTQHRTIGIFATPVTYSLLALILAGYALEEANGGGENLRALADLGAMWPPYVVGRGEWWRLGTSLFLHYGLLHLGLNCLMLYMLGRGTELAIGWWRTLLIYVGGGLCSSGFVLWLMTSGYTNHAVLMGASGAIMALFGALLTRQVMTWLRTRDVRDRREITMLAVVVAIQVAIDLSVPQISFAAHASGFITGLLIGLALEVHRNTSTRRLG